MIVLIAFWSLMSPENPGTSGKRTTTLNFFPSRAAMRIRSTSALAIRFFTGPLSTVLEMLVARG